MTKTIEEILAPKPESRPRIYAYSIDDKAHAGLLKVGQTTRGVKQRVAEQLKTGSRAPFPYYDATLLPYLQHAFWFLPNVAACHAMANLLAEKQNVFWHSYDTIVCAGVNVDNDTLRRIMDNPEAMAAVERIEDWRKLGDNVLETIINKSDRIKELKKKAKENELTKTEKKELSDEEKEYKSKRKQVQEKLIKFATKIPAFMYLTDFRENTLQDVITKIETRLFETVTGLTVKDFHLLVGLKVFNTEQMNQAVFAFRRYEDASLRYTGLESYEGLTHYGLYDTVVARE